MQYKEVIIGFILVFILAFAEYLSLILLPAWLLISVVFMCCFTKVGYVLIKCFNRIVSLSHTDLAYHQFMLFIAINLLLLIFSFSLDYFFIYKLDPSTFTGLEGTTNSFEEYFKLLYLSMLIFTTIGIANVIPVKISSEALMMFECIVSFVTLIFILSDYVTLRDSLKRLREKKEKEPEK